MTSHMRETMARQPADLRALLDDREPVARAAERLAGRRVVLTGGACQLPGVRELAGLILDKQIRIGRPLRVKGLAEATGGPAFSTCVGLLHFASSERAETPRQARLLTASEGHGLLGRVGAWLRENF
jgi:cell division protein FtsA